VAFNYVLFLINLFVSKISSGNVNENLIIKKRNRVVKEKKVGCINERQIIGILNSDYIHMRNPVNKFSLFNPGDLLMQK
jgi:hypothetical protein